MRISWRISSGISSMSLALRARQEHLLDARAVRREHLLLDAADGEHDAAQGDLARHGDVAAHRAPREERGDGG
jgi:hypothetical protein